MGFNLGWISSEMVVGYEVVIEIFGFCCQWWSLGFVATNGGGGFQYGMHLQWRWFWVLMW